MRKPITLALATHISWALNLEEEKAAKICDLLASWQGMLQDGEPQFRACESPAERLFLLATILTCQDKERQHRMMWNQDAEPGDEIEDDDVYLGKIRWREKTFSLFAQRAIGELHVDFSLEPLGPDPWDPDFWGVAIEIDGHEFHEKTKAQASTDKKRDREVQAAGYVVIRFTGSDVYKDPVATLHEALSFAWSADARLRHLERKLETEILERLTAPAPPAEPKLLPAPVEAAAE